MQMEKMTEPEAHHALQQLAMSKGMRMADAAGIVLEQYK